MAQFSFQQCPICGNVAKSTELLPVTFNYGSRHKLQECYSCKSSYFHPLPTLTDLVKFYSIHGYEFNRHSASYRASIIVRKHMNQRSAGRFLDVGCATGFLLKEVQTLSHWDVFGVELSEKAAAFAREGLQLRNVRQCDLLAAEFSTGFFDIVHISEVLEHVPEPLALLQECRRIVKPSGTFLLSLPNGLADRQGLLDYWRLHQEAPGHGSGHIFFFSKCGLESLAEKAGFRIVGGETYAFKQGLRSLGLFPERRGWEGMFTPRRDPEVANDSEITIPTDKHSASYYRIKYGLREKLKLPGLHRFGLGWHVVLKPTS
jgi:SAM-dependent methyltransferase